ncbi:GIN domain-containing protein [Specibacter sp. NPDC057265]|uniref:GIN domain-containing protein n=1 Tax=Specibacter sp. NPDC057265 TaxID=3346075 RepID=UPI003625523A
MRTSQMILSTSALALVTVAALSGCSPLGSGPTVTQDRDITDVTAVQLNTSGSLIIALGATPSLTVSAGDRIIDRLTEDVDDGVLRLAMEGNPMPLDGDIRYELTVSSLESLTVTGSGDAVVDLSGAREPTITVRGSGGVDASGIDAAMAALTVEGSGAIQVRDAALENLMVRVDGSGEVTVDGAADTQRVEIMGSGGYQGTELRSANAFVTVRGSGEATVTADEALDAVIDGSGVISHGGDARVTEDVAGSGAVTQR